MKKNTPISNLLFPAIVISLTTAMYSPVFAVGFLGDFDLNGVIDEFDANLLAGEIEVGSNDLLFDVDSNGLVELVDLDEWFEIYSADSGVLESIAIVDVNFDKANTLADFLIIKSNLSSSTTAVTDGNLLPDGLGVVNQSDLDLYISRGGVVPEPSSAMISLAALCFAMKRNRTA